MRGTSARTSDSNRVRNQAIDRSRGCQHRPRGTGPLFAAVAIAIRLDSPRPILFKQRRCGFNGRIFSIRKFRTMSAMEDKPSIIQAEPADRRVTRVGRWLRRTSIDELPQLLNVIEGTVSLVGPRPHA